MSKKIEWTYIDEHAKLLKAKKFLGGRCEVCGNDNYEQLEFHHKDKDDKNYGISKIRGHRWSIIEKEIEKCSLLCSNCHREYHYVENSVDKRTEILRNNKQIFFEFINSFSCEKCGYDKCPGALDFHHNRGEKNIGISELLTKHKWKSLVELEKDIVGELNKCVVLCSNCHRTEHFDKERFEKYYDQILDKSKNMKEVQAPLDRKVVLEMLLAGKKQVEIAKHFNASKGTISGIVKKLKEEKLIV